MPISRLSGLSRLTSKLVCVAALGITLLIPVGAQADDIQDINEMFRKGDLNGALARANQFLAKNPKDAQGRFLKGLILADQNKPGEAIQIFTAITEDYPELPEPYNNLAVLYASQGKYDAARNALEMAIRTHPSYATAHENLGDLYAKMATQAYDKALQIDGSNKTAQTKLALIKDMMSGQPRRTPPVAVAAPVSPTQPGAAKPVLAQIPPSAVSVVTNPAPSPAKSGEPDHGSSEKIIETLQSWAKAWSDKNVDAYLSYYSPDFSPSGMSHAAWAAQRRERLEAPGKILVTIRDIQIQRVSANRAAAKFQQSYASERLKNTAGKTLDLELVDGKWRILRESGR